MPTRRHHSPRPARARRGFSLIEILVVISIIGVLAAVSAGAMFRLRAAQTASNTEGTLSKLDGLLLTRWKALLDQSKATLPSALVDRCGGDKERALAIWTYATLKNELPTTFAEANATINLGPGATLAPRGIFKKVSNPTPAYSATQTPTPEQQSATLFFLSITQGGNKGNAAGTDGSNQQISTTDILDTTTQAVVGTLPVYKDGWGRPVVFLRLATGGEINAPPYCRPTQLTLGGTSTPVRNILDPRGAISVWPSPATNTWLGLFTLDTAATATNLSVLNAQLFTLAPGLAGSATSITTADNVLPTLVSAGANKKFGTYLDPAADDSADNLLSYRLRREGDKGN